MEYEEFPYDLGFSSKAIDWLRWISLSALRTLVICPVVIFWVISILYMCTAVDEFKMFFNLLITSQHENISKYFYLLWTASYFLGLLSNFDTVRRTEIRCVIYGIKAG